MRQGLGRFLARNVDAEPERVKTRSAQRLRDGFGSIGVDIGGNNSGPRLGEFLGIDLPDPLAAAGDNDAPSGKLKSLVHGHRTQSSPVARKYSVRPGPILGTKSSSTLMRRRVSFCSSR